MNTKFILLVAVAMGMGIAAEAQSVSFGPRVGVNLATLNASGGDDNLREEFNDAVGYTSGAQLGAVVNFGISDMFSFQPELLYSQRGFEASGEISEEEPIGEVNIKSQMNYLELPILGKVSFGGESLKGFVTAGPSVGYWMSGKTKYSFMGEEEAEDYEFSDDFEGGVKENRLDLGASIGIGLAYRLGPGALNLDVRYGLGISDISKYENDRPNDESKGTHRTLGISLAYLFGGR